jgi:endonuclease YncB( thermonuclease family)
MLLLAPTALLADPLPGPVPAEIVRVVDGDTVRVRATIWLDLTLEILVRIRGIDAPELHGNCPEERERAAAATAALATALGDGPLRLVAIDDDKYFGRVVADVLNEAGIPISAAMLATGLVRTYSGGARLPWCPAVAAVGGP